MRAARPAERRGLGEQRRPAKRAATLPSGAAYRAGGLSSGAVAVVAVVADLAVAVAVGGRGPDAWHRRSQPAAVAVRVALAGVAELSMLGVLAVVVLDVAVSCAPR